ncbi:ester cyclase [Apilactobacillus kunkeei]|uniref:ester cyclase n=1 Tax=Apilactobacillus kunkeei TaxID=148814 RepID=UPI004034A0B8
MDKTYNIIKTFYQSFNTGNTDKLHLILSNDWVNHPNDPGQSANIDGFKAGINEFRDAFNSFELKIIKVIIDNNDVAVHIQMSGIQVKEFAGISPKNEFVVFYGFDRHLLNDSHTKILKTWHFEDFSNLL